MRHGDNLGLHQVHRRSRTLHWYSETPAAVVPVSGEGPGCVRHTPSESGRPSASSRPRGGRNPRFNFRRGGRGREDALRRSVQRATNTVTRSLNPLMPGPARRQARLGGESRRPKGGERDPISRRLAPARDISRVAPPRKTPRRGEPRRRKSRTTSRTRTATSKTRWGRRRQQWRGREEQSRDEARARGGRGAAAKGVDRVDSCVYRGKEAEPKEADILRDLRWGRPREGG